jgi:hypothetical protein
MRTWVAFRMVSLVVVFVALLAGCLDNGNGPGDGSQGVFLEDRKICGGTFSDGSPVPCEQEASHAEVLQAPPEGWFPFRPQDVQGEAMWYFAPITDDPGRFRLGLEYEIERGPLDPEISLDPIQGVVSHGAWEAPGMWEHQKSGFVVFEQPVPRQGEFTLLIYYPHTVAMNTSLFSVSIETPALHDKPVEPLWRLAPDGLRVVHRVHGDGGPYYFHEGQPDTGRSGLSLSQSGVDYSLRSRFILLAGESGQLSVPLLQGGLLSPTGGDFRSAVDASDATRS